MILSATLQYKWFIFLSSPGSVSAPWSRGRNLRQREELTAALHSTEAEGASVVRIKEWRRLPEILESRSHVAPQMPLTAIFFPTHETCFPCFLTSTSNSHNFYNLYGYRFM